MPWIARCFLVVIGLAAVASLASACTRRGAALPVVPTAGPGNTIYVNPRSGNDAKCAATGSSSVAPTPPPCRTLTRALELLPKPSPTASSHPSPSPTATASGYYPSPSPTPFTSGITIVLGRGDYSVHSGEKFPIVIPEGVTISGAGGSTVGAGSFIDGFGEDLAYERASGAPRHSTFTTLDVTGSGVNISGVFVGSRLPPLGTYSAIDALGSVSMSGSIFPAIARGPNVDGALVPSGNLTCQSCIIGGYDGIVARTLPATGVAPVIALSKTSSDAQVNTGDVGIRTDGTASVAASSITFEGGRYAYADDLAPLRAGLPPGAVDFGFGANGSTGGNGLYDKFIATELYVTRPNEKIVALDDTWNATQHANGSGQYLRVRYFTRGSKPGKNVTLLRSAVNSYVEVGPKGAPTPSPPPTPYPSSSPSPTASPT